MKNLTVKIMLILLLVNTNSSAHAEEFTDWRLKSSKDNIAVYNRRVGNSPTLMFKTVATIDEPIDKVISVLGNTQGRARWEPYFGSGKIIKEISSYERIEYWHIATPKPILKDREFVVNTKVWVDKENNSITFQFKSVAFPYQSGFDRVRGELYESSFVLKPISTKQTQIVYILHVDPKGWCPKFIVRLVQEGYPRGFMTTVRKYLAKAENLTNPLAKDLTDQLTLPVSP